MTRRGRHQSGIALITALVLVAIATVLATAIGFSAAMSIKRASTIYGADQSLLAAEGAEAMAAYVLKQSTGSIISPDQAWAEQYGPMPLAPGITLEFAQMEDQQGKFNLNNLAPGGKDDPKAIAQFTRLLQKLNLETKWANLIADWIDSDNEALSDGAEDSTYLAQSPPYRAANTAITSISELLALPGFGRQRYETLKPYITALPQAPTAVNVCTASGVLLDALGDIDEYASVDLATQRQKGCFPTVTEYQTSVTDATAKSALSIGTTSSYFRLDTVITIGTARFTLYSLLLSNGGGSVRPLIRTFGTE